MMAEFHLAASVSGFPGYNIINVISNTYAFLTMTSQHVYTV